MRDLIRLLATSVPGAATALLLLVAMPAARGAVWIEGQHYFLIDSGGPTATKPAAAGKVEVMEVFSYGCPACDQFNPIAHELRLSLPPNAKLVFLHASFIASENWPLFQRAFCTAQILGVAEQTHDAMFDAVWKTGELSIIDPMTERPRRVMPAIEDVAKFYNRATGVPVERFLAVAKSPVVAEKMRASDELIRTYQVDRTPTIIVNGKYRVNAKSAGSYDALIELVDWLVAKESK